MKHNKALQLRTSRYAACPQLSLVVIFPTDLEMNKFLYALLLVTLSSSACAEKPSHEKKWLSLIAQKYPEGCIKGAPVVEYSIVGNNSFRVEEWAVSTCEGEKYFAVSFFPSAFFPDRNSEYEVIQK